MAWELRQYQNAYDEFRQVVAADRELLARLDQRLLRLQEFGDRARAPVSKYVENGILECRAKSAKHQARLLYCFQPQKRIVILLGIVKDQRKLKRADIEEALRRKKIIEAGSEFTSGLHQAH